MRGLVGVDRRDPGREDGGEHDQGNDQREGERHVVVAQPVADILPVAADLAGGRFLGCVDEAGYGC